MLAYANPEDVSDEKKRADGYGVAKFDKTKRTVTFECWPRFSDAAAGDKAQFPGWPITVGWDENDGRKPTAWLPVLEFEKGVNPVVKVTDAKTGEVVYAVRVNGPTFQPPVFAAGKYTIAVGRDKPDGMKLEGVEATADKSAAGTRKVKV